MIAVLKPDYTSECGQEFIDYGKNFFLGSSASRAAVLTQFGL